MLDKERLKNGSFFDQAYFDNLIAEIREIRASERRFYQKITDIYATAMDYSAEAATTQAFFATVQNKLHFAIHGHIAAGHRGRVERATEAHGCAVGGRRTTHEPPLRAGVWSDPGYCGPGFCPVAETENRRENRARPVGRLRPEGIDLIVR